MKSNLHDIAWSADNPKTGKLNMLESMITQDYGNISGIVAVQGGGLVYENYFNGCSMGDRHHVASVTKSVLSALIGIAIDKGYIGSEYDMLANYFTEYSTAHLQGITLRHILTMTAPYSFASGQDPFEEICSSNDWIGATLGLLGQGGEPGPFKYSTFGAHLLSAVLTKSTGKSAREFANVHLFAPIGMDEIPDYTMAGFGFDETFGKGVRGWVKDPGGYSAGGWGLTMSPRDMARIGRLYLNGGKWGGRQIVSSEWIKKSTAASDNNYGYMWWLLDGGAYAAMGDGGNMICCVPEQELVVAIASQMAPNPRDRWALVKEVIIPALI